ncbi:MAG: hypothetical protein ACI8PZ_004751 [Myxococcota bacterium]|jgi:hypothetical protein
MTGTADDAVPPPWVQVVGHQLPRDDGLYVRWDAENAWGTEPLVTTVSHVAERMAWLVPGAEPLMVGDMSTRGGGELFGHKTHDTGQDADLGLYLTGRRQPLDGFVDVRPHQLDLEANWLLIRELLDTGNVQFILLDQGHIDTLSAYLVEQRGFPQSYVDEVMPPPDDRLEWGTHGVVRHAPNHRSHLHVHVQRPADLL